MDFSIILTDPLVDCSRQTVEEDLEGWLGRSGEIVGGGAATDGSFADIDFSVKDQFISSMGVPAFLDQVRSVLRAAKVPASTKIIAFVSDNKTEEYSVGDDNRGRSSIPVPPPFLCPRCTAVLQPWVEGMRQQTCPLCGERVSR